MKTMKTMKTIELSTFKPKSETGSKQAFTIYFVYPKDGEPFIVKGMYKDVEAYMNKISCPYLVNITFWRGGKSRSLWQFKNIKLYHSEPRVERSYEDFDVIERHSKHRIIGYVNGKERILSLKRMPHKWIPEFDELLK